MESNTAETNTAGFFSFGLDASYLGVKFVVTEIIKRRVDRF